MEATVDKDKIQELLTRSVSKIYPSKSALEKELNSGKRLTFYMGIDPTADYVHLGHSTNYLVLERLHELGHKIIVLVGDFTAMIGDPSDKSSMRVQLTKQQVNENLKTFKDQIGKILNFDDTKNPIEFKFNSKWLANLTFQDSVELASNFTVQQMIERDSFSKRLEQNKPLYVHEFFYPFMQGYDSVAMDVDGEVGGTDQTFNMLAGRTLLKRMKNKNKFVISTTLLENPVTGEKLMSKSLGTGIALNEKPNVMYRKIMQLPDEGILQCYIDCTRIPMNKIKNIKKKLSSGTNPRDIKMHLARNIVEIYHGKELSEKAEKKWVAQVSNKQLGDDLQKISVKKNEGIIDIVIKSKVTNSKSQVRRLLNEGAIKINGKKLKPGSEHTTKEGDTLSIGKKHSFTLTLK